MEQMTTSMKGFHWGGFSAVFVTALLFTALPLLTRTQTIKPVSTKSRPVFITDHKPPPPPPDESTRREDQKMIEKTPSREADKPRRAKPKFDLWGSNPAANRSGPGYIDFREVVHQQMIATTRDIAYNPGEVDQPPRYLRTVPPQYPYLAKRDGVEGKVLLRFVVDLEGMVRDAEVVKAEPAGVFEEAALKAIERYRFRPAVKDGKTVMCNAAMTIAFVLD